MAIKAATAPTTWPATERDPAPLVTSDGKTSGGPLGVPDGLVPLPPVGKGGLAVPVGPAVTDEPAGSVGPAVPDGTVVDDDAPGVKMAVGVQSGTKICVPFSNCDMMQLKVQTASPAVGDVW